MCFLWFRGPFLRSKHDPQHSDLKLNRVGEQEYLSIGSKITDLRKVLSPGIQRHVVRLKSTDVSNEHISQPWIWRRHVPPQRRLTFNGLHSDILQMTVLFTTTAVRTLNPIHWPMFVTSQMYEYITPTRMLPTVRGVFDIAEISKVVYTTVFFY
jgi:hypothetical protein